MYSFGTDSCDTTSSRPAKRRKHGTHETLYKTAAISPR